MKRFNTPFTPSDSFFTVYFFQIIDYSSNISSQIVDCVVTNPNKGKIEYIWWLVRVTLVVGLVFLPQHFGPLVAGSGDPKT